MRLNLGCGSSKLEDYVNVDIDPSLEPDKVFDFTQKFPYENESVDEVVCYHTIEHIRKIFHDNIYAEIYRVLIPNGRFILTFPEFWECAQRWKENYQGQREFWEATIFGRQASPHDTHVSLMDRQLVSLQLINHGFKIDFCGPEPLETFNSVIKATKDHKFTYEDALCEAIGIGNAH